MSSAGLYQSDYSVSFLYDFAHPQTAPEKSHLADGLRQDVALSGEHRPPRGLAPPAYEDSEDSVSPHCIVPSNNLLSEDNN